MLDLVSFDPSAAAGKLADEPARLQALCRYNILDTPPEGPFDKITSLVRIVLGVPMSAVSLIDRDRLWLKSHPGIAVSEIPRSIAFCSHLIVGREPLVVTDTLCDQRFMSNPLVVAPPQIRAYAGVPLRSPDGYNVGSLCVLDSVPRGFDSSHIDMLSHFAGLVVDELELRRIAQRDHLTGALTRRAFIAETDRAIAQRHRSGAISSVILLDIDRFKSINDTHGHQAGNVVLQAVSNCCMALLREVDVFGRIGGEEFAILQTGADVEQAFIAAERIRQAIAALVIGHDPTLRVTASFGLAQLDAHAATSEEWLAQADIGLYIAKRAGRNRTAVNGPNLRIVAA